MKATMICHMLAGSGYEAFWVGGCVRDSWLEKKPKDYDITTDATPEQIKKVFEQFQCLDIGAAFGIISVVVEGEPFEIATFREDAKSSDSRHPDEVKFASNIETDLSRRDFTMNAIAWNLSKCEYVDPFGGIDDIQNKQIKFVGDPAERIKEDHLRVLRAYRFASQLGFEIEYNTRHAIGDEIIKGHVLDGVSQERITSEMNKILVGPNCPHTLMIMAIDGILWEIIPELKDQLQPHNNMWHLETMEHFGNSIFTHTLLVVESASKALHAISPDHQMNFMWAALLHDIGKPACREPKKSDLTQDSFHKHEVVGEEMCREILPRMKLSTKSVEEISSIVGLHMKIHELPQMKKPHSIRKLLANPYFELTFNLSLSDTLGTERNFAPSKIEEIDILVKALAKYNTQYGLKLPEPMVTGDDLIQAGEKPGPLFKKALDIAFNQQLDGIEDKQKLLRQALSYIHTKES